MYKRQSFTLLSDTELSATTPLHAAGTVNVVVTTTGGSGTLTGGYTFVDAPSVVSVSPADGPETGGQAVTVTGSGFTGATQVTFGGTPASFTLVSDTELSATTPLHAAGPVNVAVTTPGGSGTFVDGYTYLAPPTLTSVSPNEGPFSGDTAVTLTGTGFVNVLEVSFGGVPSTFTVVSDSEILASTPVHAPGTVDVAVTSGGGTATLPAAFTFQVPPP